MISTPESHQSTIIVQALDVIFIHTMCIRLKYKRCRTEFRGDTCGDNFITNMAACAHVHGSGSYDMVLLSFLGQ
mgnify:FL=1